MADKNDNNSIVLNNAKKVLNIQLGDGSEWKIPKLESLNAREARKISREFSENGEGNVDIFMDLLDKWCPGLLDRITMETFIEITRLWNSADGVDAGE